MIRGFLVLVFPVLLLAVLFGCHHPVDMKLMSADDLMDSDPYAAQKILDSIKTDSLDLNRRMLHALLKEKSVIKQHKNIDSVSIAKRVMEYYAGRRDSLEILSKLYYGKSLRQHEAYEEALVPLTLTYDLALDLHDYRSAGLAAGELAFIYSHLFVYEEELRWAELAKETYREGRLPLHEAWADLDMIEAYSKNNRCEEALRIIERLDSVRPDDDPAFLARLKLLSPWIAYVQGQHEESIRMYEEVIKEGIKPNSSIWCILGRNYLKTGDRDKAIAALAEIRPMAQNSLDSIWAFSLEAQIAAFDKDYKRAYERASEFGEKIMDDGNRRIGHPATGMLTETLRQNYRLEREISAAERQEKQLLIVVLILTVLVFVAVALYLGALVKAKKRDRELAMLQVMELQRDIDGLNQNIEGLNRDIEGLNRDMETLDEESRGKERLAQERLQRFFRHRMRNLNDLCEAWYTEPTTEAKRKSSVCKELEKLRSRESVEALEREIDECSEGWMKRFRTVFPDLPEEHYTLAMYLFSGLSQRSISILLGKKSMNTLYGVRARLKERLAQNDTADARELRSRIGLD